MAKLVILHGGDTQRKFSLGESNVIGRQPDSKIYLDALAVSRQHARIFQRDGLFFVEDVGSRGGTYLNGTQVTTAVPLREGDTLQVGPYTLGLVLEQSEPGIERPPTIHAKVSAVSSNHTLYLNNPAHKLQVVLEISQGLSLTLDVDQLLAKLLSQLLSLFPQADRGMALLTEPKKLVARDRQGREDSYPYSRSLIKKALEEGIGILSEDLGTDHRIAKTETLLALKLCSVMCVPLICQTRRLGVIQLDSLRPGKSFRDEDLELLTTVALQAAVVLEHAALHAERLREERFRQELALARQIQQGFLPADFRPLGASNFELFARVHPAREVSGDLYDFFPLPDGRLAFLVGDVSGKGMPAALFMIAVRTLCRHLCPSSSGPAEMMTRLNNALADDNPLAMFVTLIQGIYDPQTSEVTLCSGGHPHPMLRRADGKVELVQLPQGRLLGFSGGRFKLQEARISLAPGDTLVLYTDGFTEAHTPDRVSMFEIERLREVIGRMHSQSSLETWAEVARLAIQQFTGASEQEDDLTLLLLRRNHPTPH